MWICGVRGLEMKLSWALQEVDQFESGSSLQSFDEYICLDDHVDDDDDDDDQFERGSSLQSSNEYLPHLNKHTE